MRASDLSHITTASTVSELPGYEEVVEISVRAKTLADLFHRQPDLPGVLLTERGAFRTAISRRYYLEMVGRYCGADLYHPRPIGFMMSRLDELGGPLVLAGSTPIQDAVRRGLDRPRALVYEPLVVRQEGLGEGDGPGVRLVDFEDLLAADSRLTLLRNEQMHQILSTVREGLLLVDRRLEIAPEYSRSVEEILGLGGLAGRSFPEILLRLLDAERAQVAGEYVETLFNPEVIESLVTRINPLLKVEAQCGGHRGGRRKVLSFRFTRALEGRTVRHVLVRVEDVTREEELARELEEQRHRSERRLELALGLAQADPDALAPLLRKLEDECRHAAGMFGPRQAELLTRPALDELLRGLHGAKGEAGLLGLKPLQTAIHLLEEPLGELRRRGRLDRQLAADVERRRDGVEAVLAEARDLVEQFARLGRVAARPGLLASISQLTARLSEELGKPARFVSRTPEEAIPPACRDLVQEALVQLVRNALVHGVEPPEVRRRSGKPAVATLQLAARQQSGQLLELVFQDDGAGLDLERIRAKADELGLAAGPDDDGTGLIFQPGFSTAREAGLHAGRGLGLDLLRARVEESGGRIAVHSQPGRFCAFQILLPQREGEAAA